MSESLPDLRKGRGAVSNRSSRFESCARESFDDGWGSLDEELPALETVLSEETARTIISTNDSPDIPFDQSINPYRGCEHGCIYCFARPSHAYVGLSPGLDFESRLFFKPNAPALLRRALGRNNECRVIALGSNTDPYQPIERKLQLTRQLLEVAHEHGQPLVVVTKSSLILRDLDILAAMAAERLVSVRVSVTTLDRALARRMEPRAAAPQRRIETIARLSDAGVTVGVLASPMIPALNDVELERILESAASAGAVTAAYILIRLPHEVKELFAEWLRAHYPDRAERVLSLIRQTRDGALYRSAFDQRMRGTGPYAELLARRFALATRRLGLDQPAPPLATDRRKVPTAIGNQLPLPLMVHGERREPLERSDHE